jgi:hypothetical protein
MELLDRYLQAVKFWLPKAQKQDIIAELSEDIHSQIEEKETELGRKLNEAEVEAILKSLGRPILVANRYSPQQYLIGPVLFPIYRFVLKIVGLCYLLSWILSWMGSMTFALSGRAQDSVGALMSTLASMWGPLWLAAFFAFGVVTIVFAVLERSQAKSRFLEDWDPRKLPAVRDSNQISRASSAFELAANTVFCMWWIGIRSPLVLGQSVSITLAPVWRYFFWGFLVLALANIAVSGVNLLRPYWTRARASIRLATDVIGMSLFCWLCKSGIVVGISIPAVAPAKTLEITNAINLWMSKSFLIAVAAGVVIAAFDVHRIIRAKTSDRQLLRGMAAGGWPTSAVS